MYHSRQVVNTADVVDSSIYIFSIIVHPFDYDICSTRGGILVGPNTTFSVSVRDGQKWPLDLESMCWLEGRSRFGIKVDPQLLQARRRS